MKKSFISLPILLLTTLFSCSNQQDFRRVAADQPTPWQDSYKELTRETLKLLMLDTASFQLSEVGQLESIVVPDSTVSVWHVKKYHSADFRTAKLAKQPHHINMNGILLGVETPIFVRKRLPGASGFVEASHLNYMKLGAERYVDTTDHMSLERLSGRSLAYRSWAIYKAKNGFGGYTEARAWLFYDKDGRVLNVVNESIQDLQRRHKDNIASL